MSNKTNAANLLNRLLGEVTEEQKEIYKKIQHEQGDLVISEVFSDTQSSDDEQAPSSSKQAESSSITSAIGKAGDQVVIEFPSDVDINNDSNNQTCLHWDSQLHKYVNGDISFSELTNIMESKLQIQSDGQQPQADQRQALVTPNVVIEEDFSTAESSDADNLLDDLDSDEDKPSGKHNDQQTKLDTSDDDDDFECFDDSDESSDGSQSDEDRVNMRNAEAFVIELDSHSRRKQKNKTTRVKSSAITGHKSGGRRKRLANDLSGLVGQANLHFVRGDHEGAIKMCLEVIRLAPTAPEPFQTLGLIYEERKEFEKAYQYNLISAYLNPSDGDHWTRVAEMAIEQKQYQQAIICYSKAIKIDPDNILLHVERCKLYQKVDDKKKALEGYEHVISMIHADKDDHHRQEALFIAKEIAKIHYFNHYIDQAIRIMEENLAHFHDSIINEDINLYLELLLSDKQYLKALRAFQKYCGIQFKLNGDIITELNEQLLKESASQIKAEVLYSNLQIDLRAKLVVCLINLDMLKSVKSIEKSISSESVNEMGDLFLDIADAYIKIGHEKEAESLLCSLVSSAKYSQASIWLRYARCLHTLKKSSQAIAAYHEVIQQQPTCNEARLELTHLLHHLDQDQEAVNITNQADWEAGINLDLLHLRVQLLYKLQQHEEFLRCARIILASEIKFLHDRQELGVMITSTTYRSRIDSLKDVYKEQATKRGIVRNQSNEYNYVGGRLSTDELLDVYRQYCDVLFREKKNDELIKTVLSAYTCALFAENEKYLDFIALNVCFLLSNQRYSYQMCKAIITNREMENHQVWNLFSAIMMRIYQDLRHNKFCLRLFVRHPDKIQLAYINGHNALMSGSYKHALAEYVSILKQTPTDPFAVFCIALGYTHLICQKFLTHRHSVVVQLCAFLSLYLEMRGECQETCFNVGRAFHQIGLVSEATYFYKKALVCTDQIQNSDQHELEEIFCLNREIVFNLCLIYKTSGSTDLALHYMHKYCTI